MNDWLTFYHFLFTHPHNHSEFDKMKFYSQPKQVASDTLIYAKLSKRRRQEYRNHQEYDAAFCPRKDMFDSIGNSGW